MDIRRLQCFQAVVEEQGLGKAAEKLRLAPSALSRQISLLEHELGRSLFSRESKRLTPTAEGLYLYERCARLLQDVAHLRQDVASFAATPRGHVSLGIPPSLRELVALPVVAQLTAAHPEIVLSLAEGMTMHLRDRVAGGELDAALLATVEPAGDLQLLPLARESLMLVGPPRARLRPDKPVTVAQALENPLVISPSGNSIRKVLESAAQRLRRAVPVRCETTLAETLIGLVRMEVGFGILPCSGAIAAARRGEVTIAPVQGLHLSWAFCKRKDLIASPALRSLERALIEHFALVAETSAWPSSKWIGSRREHLSRQS